MRNNNQNNMDGSLGQGLGNGLNVSQAQAESIVQDIVEGNIGNLAQDVLSVGMNNLSEDRLARMGLNPQSLGGMQNGNQSMGQDMDPSQFDVNMTRRGRSLYGSGQTMNNDEMLDPDFNQYNDANYEDVDPNMDTYDAQQAREQMQQSMDDVKNGKISLFSRIIMILILLGLIFVGWKIAKVMFDSFRSNIAGFKKSDVVEETVDTLRGGQTDTKSEMEGYIDGILNATPEDTQEEIEPEVAEEANNGNNTPAVDNATNSEPQNEQSQTEQSQTEQNQAGTESGGLRSKQYSGAEAPYVLAALSGLRYENGIYTPTFEVSKYFLNDKEHVLEVGGVEKIRGTFLSSTYYTVDGDTLIVKAPDGTYWRCNVKGFEDKQGMKSCGTVSIYYYYSKILQEIIGVEYVNILTSYDIDELVGNNNREELEVVAENQILKSLEDSIK